MASMSRTVGLEAVLAGRSGRYSLALAFNVEIRME
jgi:hypothetical protein